MGLNFPLLAILAILTISVVTRNMVNNPSYQPDPQGASDAGTVNDAQHVRKRDVIRGILGFSKSKPKEIDATAPNQA
ncbi:hypothetical protein BGZ89_006903, partial [Linnemannia elongata]